MMTTKLLSFCIHLKSNTIGLLNSKGDVIVSSTHAIESKEPDDLVEQIIKVYHHTLSSDMCSITDDKEIMGKLTSLIHHHTHNHHQK